MLKSKMKRRRQAKTADFLTEKTLVELEQELRKIFQRSGLQPLAKGIRVVIGDARDARDLGILAEHGLDAVDRCREAITRERAADAAFFGMQAALLAASANPELASLRALREKQRAWGRRHASIGGKVRWQKYGQGIEARDRDLFEKIDRLRRLKGGIYPTDKAAAHAVAPDFSLDPNYAYRRFLKLKRARES